MGAHLRDITAKCADCGKPATVQLFTTWNDPMGKYCARDGAKRLKAAQEAEARHQRRADTVGR